MYIGFQTPQLVDSRCRTIKIEYLQVLTRLKNITNFKGVD